MHRSIALSVLLLGIFGLTFTARAQTPPDRVLNADPGFSGGAPATAPGDPLLLASFDDAVRADAVYSVGAGGAIDFLFAGVDMRCDGTDAFDFGVNESGLDESVELRLLPADAETTRLLEMQTPPILPDGAGFYRMGEPVVSGGRFGWDFDRTFPGIAPGALRFSVARIIDLSPYADSAPDAGADLGQVLAFSVAAPTHARNGARAALFVQGYEPKTYPGTIDLFADSADEVTLLVEAAPHARFMIFCADRPLPRARAMAGIGVLEVDPSTAIVLADGIKPRPNVPLDAAAVTDDRGVGAVAFALPAEIRERRSPVVLQALVEAPGTASGWLLTAACPVAPAPRVEDAVYVAMDGNDAAAGTAKAPLRTINAALRAADRSGAARIFVAAGEYAEDIAFRDGLSVTGGCLRASWHVDRMRPSRIIAVTAPFSFFGAGAPTRFENLVFVGPAPEADAEPHAIAADIRGAVDAEFAACSFIAADGRAGRNGAAGRYQQNGGLPGAGGDGATARGASGKPGKSGDSGSLPNGGAVAGGGGGSGGAGSLGRGANGRPGSGGGAGRSAPDAPLTASLDRDFLLEGGRYVTAPGKDGAASGAGGAGGGGGGGGAGTSVHGLVARGGDGGVGGAGGFGATGGMGGGGGGASFGVFVVESRVRFLDCFMRAGRAGTGGRGGDGLLRSAGTPGAGGMRGSTMEGTSGGAGGDGGPGGSGGASAGGGGGSGGRAFALFSLRSAVDLSEANNRLIFPPAGADGGTGGRNGDQKEHAPAGPSGRTGRVFDPNRDR